MRGSTIATGVWLSPTPWSLSRGPLWRRDECSHVLYREDLAYRELPPNRCYMVTWWDTYGWAPSVRSCWKTRHLDYLNPSLTGCQQLLCYYRPLCIKKRLKIVIKSYRHWDTLWNPEETLRQCGRASLLQRGRALSYVDVSHSALLCWGKCRVCFLEMGAFV